MSLKSTWCILWWLYLHSQVYKLSMQRKTSVIKYIEGNYCPVHMWRFGYVHQKLFTSSKPLMEEARTMSKRYVGYSPFSFRYICTHQTPADVFHLSTGAEAIFFSAFPLCTFNLCMKTCGVKPTYCFVITIVDMLFVLHTNVILGW